VIGIATLLHDAGAFKRLVAEVVFGAAAYVVVLALIDRTTVDILRGILSDMRQLKTAA
jgi:hypothetical protein